MPVVRARCPRPRVRPTSIGRPSDETIRVLAGPERSSRSATERSSSSAVTTFPKLNGRASLVGARPFFNPPVTMNAVSAPFRVDPCRSSVSKAFSPKLAVAFPARSSFGPQQHSTRTTARMFAERHGDGVSGFEVGWTCGWFRVGQNGVAQSDSRPKNGPLCLVSPRRNR